MVDSRNISVFKTNGKRNLSFDIQNGFGELTRRLSTLMYQYGVKGKWLRTLYIM